MAGERLRSDGSQRSLPGTQAPAADYGAMLAQFAQSLAPGGEMEQSRIAQVDKEAKMLMNQIIGGNISRGLGNVDLGVEATVGTQAAAQRQQVRSSMMGQYLQQLQFLSGLHMQQQQLAAQTSAAQGPTMAQRGLDAFGKPMSGTLAEAELRMAESQLNRAVRPTSMAPSAEQYPALYNAGGMLNRSLGGLGLDDNPFAIGGTSAGGTEQPIMFSTPMMGTSEQWRRDTNEGQREVGFI
jgi:hypothetical protein